MKTNYKKFLIRKSGIRMKGLFTFGSRNFIKSPIFLNCSFVLMTYYFFVKTMDELWVSLACSIY